MRIYFDINRIGSDPTVFVIQTGPTPPIGTTTSINGKFILDVPEGVPVPNPISNTVSALLDQTFQGLLSLNPQFSFVTYNALWTAADMSNLDLSGTLTTGPWTSTPVRAQVGRASAPSGLAPNSVAILPQNSASSPNRPGLLLSDVLTSGPDVTVFMVYWKILGFQDTNDVMDYTAPNGTNTPAIRQLVEVDQSPTNLQVYVTVNGGSTWTEVQLLSQYTVDGGTSVQIAFVNTGTTPIYLASYAILTQTALS